MPSFRSARLRSARLRSGRLRSGRLTAALALLLACASPAAAQQVLAEYFAMLNPHDMRNSSGNRLTGMGDVLQQDRANYHRFGIADEYDQWDPLFSSREMRARIPDLYARGPGAPGYIAQAIRSGQPRFVWVRVIGVNGVPAYLLVEEGAG